MNRYAQLIIGSFLMPGALFFFIYVADGQANPYIPTVVPPSPNAAALMKFTDVPVSLYTGTADVTVPIYDIQAKGLTVPISLNYHTGGIRLKEESGWVGLGWALNAGGMISRTIMGKDDFFSGGSLYFTSSIPEIVNANFKAHPIITGFNFNNILGIYGYDFTCSDSVYTDVGTKDFNNALANSPSPYEFEPDQYNFSFPGGSGKFIISRSGKVIIQDQANLKIQYEAGGNSFTITDDKGNRFFFADKEYVEPDNSSLNTSISSWFLSTIITQIKDTVRFNYTTDNTWTSVQGDHTEVFRYGCTGNGNGEIVNQTNPPVDYLNKTLSSIDFANGQVQFSFDNNRVDLLNGTKLNAVKIFAKNGNSLSFIKENDLYFSYFNNGYGALEFERLKLDSVKEVAGNYAAGPYVFKYDTLQSYQLIQSSAKHSYNVDHWGFFNGNTENTQFTPTFEGFVNLSIHPNAWVDYAGANRETDSVSAKAFVLNQVTYPTGGSTMFNYEPNFYDYQQSSVAGTPDFQQTPLIDTLVSFSDIAKGTTTGIIDCRNIFGGVPNATLSVTFRNPAAYRNNNGKIYFTLNGTSVDVSDIKLDCSGNSVCTLSQYPITMNAAVYTWTAYIDPSVGSDFEGIYVTLNWQEPKVQHYKNTMLMAGGLRVKTITDYSSPGIVAKQRRFDYTHLANNYGWGTMPYSNGILMTFPTYLRYEPVKIADGICTYVNQTSSSNTSINSVIQGNIVGYSQVTEYETNPVTGADIGKAVYNYFNSPDTIINYGGFRLPGILNIGNNFNGSLLSSLVYVNNSGTYTPVKVVDNFYHTANRTVYWNCKNTPTGITGPFPCPAGYPNVAAEFIAEFYQSIKSEKVLLDSTVIYYQGTTTGQKFYYDNPVHNQLTRSVTYDSKANKHISFVKYPQDYLTGSNTQTGNTIMDSLINKNMISETIEKRDSLFHAGSASGLVTGAILSKQKLLSSGSIVMDKQYQLAIAGTITDFRGMSFSGNTVSQDSRYRLMASLDNYDNAGNITQYTTTDQLPVSFVWDYKFTYPVAMVKKSGVANIAYTSFEADGKGGWAFTGSASKDTSSPTGNYCYNVGQASGTITRAGLIAGHNYKISYWTKNSTAFSSIAGNTTGYPKQGKTIRGWTYFEHRVTGLSSLTISGTGYIDELRLYPDTAQMTTYTFSPLVGMTSQCDANNRITYYVYDALNRLSYVRDQDKNIIKKYCYKYNGQPLACDVITFYNTAQAPVFTRDNCTGGNIGGNYTYNVPYGKYVSILSQSDADGQAIREVAINGQHYADSLGTCTPPPMINLTYTNTTIYTAYIQLTNTETSTIYNFTLNANTSASKLAGQIQQGAYNVNMHSAGPGPYTYRIYSFTQFHVSTLVASNVVLSACCASAGVSN